MGNGVEEQIVEEQTQGFSVFCFLSLRSHVLRLGMIWGCWGKLILFCFLHVLKGNQRRLNQKLNSKAPVEVVDPGNCGVDPAKPFQCPRCLRLFKTTQGRAVHMHSCKASKSSATVKSKASPMAWEGKNINFHTRTANFFERVITY